MSFNLCLVDGSRIEGTYKIDNKAKLCFVSIQDVADSKYANTSIWDEDDQSCHIRKACQPNASSFDKHRDEDTKKDNISMAMIVVDILCFVSATQSTSKRSDNVCPNKRSKLHDSVECHNEQASVYFKSPHQKATVHGDTERKHIAFSYRDDSKLSCDDLDRNSSDRANLTGCDFSSGICEKYPTN